MLSYIIGLATSILDLFLFKKKLISLIERTQKKLKEKLFKVIAIRKSFIRE